MGGGLMQLVAYGAQDIYLTGNPQITFFKVVYRRHTNFSMEAIEQTWNGSSTANGRCSATISRNGDLVHRMYLEIVGTTESVTAGEIDNIGAKGITNVEIEIGGQKIDKHTGLWMETWAELTQPNPSGTVGTLGANTGTLFQNMSGMGGSVWASGSHPINIPLQFWFCRNPGLALPLIALQYHEVKVILEHQFKSLFTTTFTTNKLWCDYIYLDTDERRRFAQVSHEYLIEQLQYQTLSGGDDAGSSDLNFNHPVKELIWVDDSGGFKNGSGLLAADDGAGTLTKIADAGAATYQLKLNGHDRFAARDVSYFTRTQVHAHHSGCGGLNSSSVLTAGGMIDGIAVYSFALKPEEHQPSGTCNFSRIDNAQLVTTGTQTADTIFAVNYNVLRIMSGMGGLAYSN